MGAWVNKFHTIVVAIASFCLCCVWARVQRDFCGFMGKFHTIVAAVASFFVCVVFGPMVQCDFVGVMGKFRTIVAAVAGFYLCCVWADGAVQLCGCGQQSLRCVMFQLLANGLVCDALHNASASPQTTLCPLDGP